jgi:hypothetical protein
VRCVQDRTRIVRALYERAGPPAGGAPWAVRLGRIGR